MNYKTIRWGLCASIAAATGLLAAVSTSGATGPGASAVREHSVARVWNEQMLDAIRIDKPRPTVHARNLFHVSAAMYDAWAAYDRGADGFFVDEDATADDIEAARAEAISFAAYRVLRSRFFSSPSAPITLRRLDTQMDDLGYDRDFDSTDGPSPAALGNRIAATVIAFGLTDGSNEQGSYLDTTGYVSVNPPLRVGERGTVLNDPNRWQPLILTVGNGLPQLFLTPHWGEVTPFAAMRDDPDLPYYDTGLPPLLGGEGDAKFKDDILAVIRYSSWLDPDLAVMINISPSVVGNNDLGFHDGTGHPINPHTGEPYPDNIVNRGDWGRVLAEFWADGPNSETPPGHWNTIANEVSDNPLLEKRIGGRGEIVGDLEWDIKLYFAINGAVHDAAITAWDMKEYYDYVRPISMIRYMGGLGQSSDSKGLSYHPNGLPLHEGLVEVITAETTEKGERHEHLAGFEGQIALFCWAGYPDNPGKEFGGCDWVLAEDWLPYQAENFVTPPFPGYTSGHSTFSRAAAEVMAAITGTEFFPGGFGSFSFTAGEYLRFENGPSEDLTLQWATYYDAADEAGLSRLPGGIHVAADDFEGRISGSIAGKQAWRFAREHYRGLISCPADWDSNRVVNAADVGRFITAYFVDLSAGTLETDVTNDGEVTPADVAEFIMRYLDGVGVCD